MLDSRLRQLAANSRALRQEAQLAAEASKEEQQQFNAVYLGFDADQGEMQFRLESGEVVYAQAISPVAFQEGGIYSLYVAGGRAYASTR